MYKRRDGLEMTLALAAASTRPGFIPVARAQAAPVFELPPLAYGFNAIEPYRKRRAVSLAAWWNTVTWDMAAANFAAAPL